MAESRLQIKSRENDAKEEVRAERFVQQQRILAQPVDWMLVV